MILKSSSKRSNDATLTVSITSLSEGLSLLRAVILTGSALLILLKEPDSWLEPNEQNWNAYLDWTNFCREYSNLPTSETQCGMNSKRC
jgi:hypothetical protein